MSDIPKSVAFNSDAIPTITLSWHHLPLTKLIHENFSVIMAYAFSTPVLSKWVRENFRGEWKYLHKALFEIPVERANFALLEFATQFRLLDDRHKISDYFKQTKYPPFGKVTKQDGTEEPLYFRDMTNKIMHSSAIEWELSDPDNPIIICHSPDPPRWLRVEIQISHLAFYCGGLMS
jgi:hypothetical protein